MPGSKKAAAVAPDTSSGLVALYRCSCVAWKPSPIVCISACPDGTVIAVAREDGDIEFWDTDSWSLTSVIPGKADSSITALAWTYDDTTSLWRLFSFGLDTNIVEWDLRSAQVRAVTSSMGGAIWDAAAQPSSSGSRAVEQDGSLVAIGTDDGAVRVMIAEPGGEGLQYHKSFGRVDARALCVQWSPDGSIVYAGFSDGCIRANELSTGHEVLRITAAPAAGKAPAQCIWSLSVLADGTLASGSSRGSVQMWEPQFGTLVGAFHQHSGDVTALAASPDGTRLWASGVDPSLVMLQRQPSDTEGAASSFQYSDRKRAHTHDVRTLCIVTPPLSSPFLVSGGNDAQLLVHSVDAFERQHPVRVCRAPQAPVLALQRPAGSGDAGGGAGKAGAPPPPRILSQTRNTLDVWRAPPLQAASSKARPAQQDGEAAPLALVPAHLAHIRLPGATHATASALSSSAFVAACTPHETYLAALSTPSIDSATPGGACTASDGDKDGDKDGDEDDDEAAVDMIPLPPGVPGGLALEFSVAADALFVGAADGRLVRVDLGPDAEDDERVAVVHTFATASRGAFASARMPAGEQVRPAFSDLHCSPCGTWLAAVTPAAVHLVDLRTLKLHGSLPISPNDGAVTAVAFSSTGDDLAVCTTEVKLALFSCTSLLPATWLQGRADVAAKLDELTGHVVRVSCRAHTASGGGGGDDDVLLCTNSAMCVLSLAALQGAGGDAAGKKRRRRSASKPLARADPVGSPIRILPLESVCLGAAFVGNGAALLVEADWESVLKALPLPLHLKLYGQ